MAIKLNHTIVFARDKKASSKFLTDLFGLPAAKPFGPFLAVQVGDVTLDFDEVDEVAPTHYAFLVSEAEFDTIFAPHPRAQTGLLGRSRSSACPGEINTP